MNKKFQSILITGASSGIGFALAELYAGHDIKLFLMGRSQDRLQEISNICTKKGASVEFASIDVTAKSDMSKQIIAWDKLDKIDLVIANAGISQKGEEGQEQVEQVLNININGVVNTIYPLIARMKERRSGSIGIMSSLAGFRGMPSAASYSASKNAVRALGDALRPELKRYNIDVSVICPGFIKTPLTDVNPFPMPFLIEAEESAQIIKYGLSKNKKRIIFPWQMRILTWLMVFLPVSITDYLLDWSSQRKKLNKK